MQCSDQSKAYEDFDRNLLEREEIPCQKWMSLSINIILCCTLIFTVSDESVNMKQICKYGDVFQ